MKKDYTTLVTQAVSDYYNILTTIQSRSTALRKIADRATSDFGEYITPGNLNVTDEIDINFIELLDQIVYEFRDNIEHNTTIRDYIIDDLYSKISLTLEVLNDMEKYLRNLKNRSLFPDDLMIIRNRKIPDMVPLLLSEAGVMTNLHNEIIKTLLYYNEDSLLEYFYNSFKFASTGFIKSAALLGLKYNSGKRLNWTTIRESGASCSELINYAKNYNIENIAQNPKPSSREEMTFTLLNIEKNSSNLNDTETVNYIISLLISIPSFNFENSWLHEINTSICNILLHIDPVILKGILNNEPVLVKTMQFVDFLPGIFFNRLTGLLDELGMEFLYNLNAAVEKKKILICSSNSNILNYLCWNITETI